MKIKYLLLSILLVYGQTILAQDNVQDESHHEHHLNEIGLVTSPVYFVNEKEVSFSYHFHYVRNIHESKFGYGIGYERITGEHKHNTIGLVGSYRPIEDLSVNLSPGITFESHGGETASFALHFELTYEFELHDFHVGPAFEVAYDPEDIHLSLGLHIGYGF